MTATSSAPGAVTVGPYTSPPTATQFVLTAVSAGTATITIAAPSGKLGTVAVTVTPGTAQLTGYVSPATQTFTVAFPQSSATPEAIALSSQPKACATASASGGTTLKCTLLFDPPVLSGTQQVVVRGYASADTTQTPLSAGAATIPTGEGTAESAALAMGGIPAALTLSTYPMGVMQGNPETFTIAAAALDGANLRIAGPYADANGAAAPLSLKLGSAPGFTLSAGSLPAASPAPTLSYSGVKTLATIALTLANKTGTLTTNTLISAAVPLATPDPRPYWVYTVNGDRISYRTETGATPVYPGGSQTPMLTSWTEDLHNIAYDAHNGVIYASDEGNAFYGYAWSTGNPIPLPAGVFSGVPYAMQILPDGQGNVYIIKYPNQILRFNESGKLLAQTTLGAQVIALAYNPRNAQIDVVWSPSGGGYDLSALLPTLVPAPSPATAQLQPPPYGAVAGMCFDNALNRLFVSWGADNAGHATAYDARWFTPIQLQAGAFSSTYQGGTVDWLWRCAVDPHNRHVYFSTGGPGAMRYEEFDDAGTPIATYEVPFPDTQFYGSNAGTYDVTVAPQPGT